MGTAKRFPELRKEPAFFKERHNDFSTMGQMPSYLKKSTKRR
jgi:hypothetical protein